MDEQHNNGENVKRPRERHLHLVPPPPQRKEARKPLSWPFWASLGLIFIALVVPALLRSPEPGGDTVRPIGLRRTVATDIGELLDAIQLVHSALAVMQPDWRQAADRAGALKRRWLQLRPSIEPNRPNAWQETDLEGFEATLDGLSDSIRDEDLAQARTQVTTLDRIVRNYIP